MKNIEDIEIDTIKEILPGLLVHKFALLGVKTLGDITHLNTNDLLKIRGTGKKSVADLLELQKRISNNPKEFLEYFESVTKVHLLPLNRSYPGEFLFSLLDEAIFDFINLNKNELYKRTILLYYGLSGNKTYTLDEIGSYSDVTRERVRQVKDKMKNLIGRLVRGQFIDEYKCQLYKPLVAELNKLSDRLLTLNIFTFEQLKNLFRADFNYQISEKNEGLIRLLIESLGMEFAGKAESNFTKAEFIFCKQAEKRNFFTTARVTLKVLQEIVKPISEMDAIIKVKKSNRSFINSHIKTAINLLPEIEILSSKDQTFYQVSFEALSNARDRAFRILKERGNSMYIDEIVAEINHKLANSETPKIYDWFSLALASDKRFKAKQKTGYWDLSEWNTNRDRIEDLIRNTLHSLDKPATAEEIIDLIKEERPQLKEKSIKSLIGRDCLKVECEKFILPEWKQRYPSLAFIKRKQRINTNEPEHKTLLRQKIIEFLKNKDEGSDKASKIIKTILPLDSKFKRQAFYKIFNETQYFKKINENGNLKIQLVQPKIEIVLSADKYNWIELKEKIIREIGKEFNNRTHYKFSLEEVLELLYAMITIKTKETGLNGLADRIFPQLSRLYLETHDRTDKLNLIKQLLSLADVILKKVLFFINNTDYLKIKKSREGLGKILDKLSRIDSTKVRYKQSIDEVQDSGFKRYVYIVYTSRNNDIHNAEDLSELEIINIATSCLLFYAYSIAEYYIELKTITNN